MELPMTEKVGLDGRVFRSAAKKLAILADAEANGITIAAGKYNVGANLIARWRENRKRIEKQAAREAKELGKAKNGNVNGTHVRVTDAKGNTGVIPRFMTGAEEGKPSNGHSTASTITGLGAMITEIRAVVVKELATELTPIIEGIIDQRMGEIVSREIRRALEAKPG